MEPSPAQRAARDRIAAELAQAGFARPGTLTVRKIGGKTMTRRLTSAELAEYQPLLDNAKKLRALLSELQDLTLEIIEAGSGQEP